MCKLGNRDDTESSLCGVFNGYKIPFPCQLLFFSSFINLLCIRNVRVNIVVNALTLLQLPSHTQAVYLFQFIPILYLSRCVNLFWSSLGLLRALWRQYFQVRRSSQDRVKVMVIDIHWSQILRWYRWRSSHKPAPSWSYPRLAVCLVSWRKDSWRRPARRNPFRDWSLRYIRAWRRRSVNKPSLPFMRAIANIPSPQKSAISSTSRWSWFPMNHLRILILARLSAQHHTKPPTLPLYVPRERVSPIRPYLGRALVTQIRPSRRTFAQKPALQRWHHQQTDW